MIFTIIGSGLSVAFIVLGCCAKIGWPFALLSGAWGLPQIGAVAYAGYAYHMYYQFIFIKWPLYGYILVASISMYIFINIIAFIYLTCNIFPNDYKYKQWRKSAKFFQLIYLFFILFTSLLNHKQQNLLFFGLSSTPKLDSTSKLRYLGISSAASLICSILFITVFILLIY